MPDLSPREELVLLARTLWREGYDDHLAGHITYRQSDGTFLCNPWLLLWEELRPDDLLVIDLEGNRLEGDWPVPLGIPLHLELHRQRRRRRGGRAQPPPVRHGLGRPGPGAADATTRARPSGAVSWWWSTSTRGRSTRRDSAAKAVSAMGSADMALLANHGVFVLGNSVRAVHQRAVALEQRCRRAWQVESLGGGTPRSVPSPTWWPRATARASSASGRRRCGPSWRPTRPF